jgi:lysyl endopeptidase
MAELSNRLGVVFSFQLLKLVVFHPNLSPAVFTVSGSNFMNVAYEISSITGQRIQAETFSNGNNTLSMQSKAAGMYFIRITDLESNISMTKKL